MIAGLRVCALLTPVAALRVGGVPALRGSAALRVGARPLMSAAEKEVEATLRGYVAGVDESSKSKDGPTIEAMLKKFVADGAILIRPSGNPLPWTGLKDMWTSPDVNTEMSEIVSVDSMRIFADGKAAVATYTCHDKFSYQGTPNDDIAKYTAVLEKVGDSWMMVHGHRATGQPPE